MTDYKVYIFIGIFTLTAIIINWNNVLSLTSTVRLFHQNNSIKLDMVPDFQNVSHSVRLMLSVRRKGRLGNAMWEYSALYGLANLTNRSALLNPGFRDLTQIFTLSTPLKNRVELFETFHRYNHPDQSVPHDVQRTATILRNISENVMLDGYFQYFRFFDHVKNDIRKQFTFRKKIRKRVTAFFNKYNLNEKNVVTVGVHVRRGALARPSWVKKGFGPPDVAYFQNAMEYFKKKYKRVHFLVCSDDLKWTRQHIKGDDITYVSGNSAEVDMAILTSCDHVIISNGTFSWWVGWLCTGTTVRYKRIPKYYSGLYNMTSGHHWPPNDAFNHYVAIDSNS